MYKILSISQQLQTLWQQNYDVMSKNFSVSTCKISSSKKNGDYGDNDIIIIDGGGGNHHHL